MIKRIDTSELLAPQIKSGNYDQNFQLIEEFVIKNDLGLFLENVILDQEDNAFVLKLKHDQYNQSKEDQIPIGNSRDMSWAEKKFTKKFQIIPLSHLTEAQKEEFIKREQELRE